MSGRDLLAARPAGLRPFHEYGNPAFVAGAAIGVILLALVLARAPLFTAGAVMGVLVVLLVLWRPLVLLGVMLAIGPLDLSFVTGGFKNLSLGSLGGLDMNGIRLVGVVLGFGLLAAIHQPIRREVTGPYGRVYLTFLLFAGATLTYSLAPADGVRLLFKLAYPLIIFVAVLGLARSRAELDRLADYTLVGAAIITIVLNPIYVAAGTFEADVHGTVRIGGVGAHQNPFSFYLLTIFLVALGRYIVRRHLRYLVLMLACAAWMAATMTRSTMLAALAALGVLGVTAAVSARNVRALVITFLLGGALAALFMPFFVERTFGGNLPGFADLIRVVRDPAQIVTIADLSGRTVIWGVVYAAFLTSPVIGIGLGASNTILQRFFLASEGHVAHNEYLRLMTETGVIGLALFGAAMIMWWLGVLRATRAQARRSAEFAWPAVALLTAWTVVSISDNSFDYYAPFGQYLGFMCAATIVIARLHAREARTPRLEEVDVA